MRNRVLIPNRWILALEVQCPHRTSSAFLSNVADQLHLLASGTKACSAGDVPEVRFGAQVLAESVC